MYIPASTPNTSSPTSRLHSVPANSPSGPVRARVIHLREGIVIILRDTLENHGWQKRFSSRIRECGPWEQPQIEQYFERTYGAEQKNWPIQSAAIRQLFGVSPTQCAPTLSSASIVARERPEVRLAMSA